MKRRTFVELAGLGLANRFVPRAFAAAASPNSSDAQQPPATDTAATFGSGHFGQWETDAHGLPAYRYTCDQLTDPLAVLPVDKTFRSPTDHMHQVGNDRLVAVASNYGHLQVRQDEGSPKFLNDFDPDQNRYGGGIGFLADAEGIVLSTFYNGKPDTFDRVFGMGYLQKRVAARNYSVDQIVFAPYGDDPVLVSQVTITNHSAQTVSPRWVEYWGCQNYQFSYRSLMESAALPGSPSAVERRRDFAARFKHSFGKLAAGKGLMDTQTFLGRTAEEERAWQQTEASLSAKPTGFFGGAPAPLAGTASMDDLAPPPTFLASLDAAPSGFATNANRFFHGGIDQPTGMDAPLRNELNSEGPESAFFLERQVILKPNESRTLYFLYGYVPQGFSAEALIARYAADPASNFEHSCAQWKSHAPIFRASAHPWVEREATWGNYYLRSGLTYDNFFNEHILSQGASYQYLAGLQGAARDPLQHALPFIFTEPSVVRGILRYTLKEIQPDGSIPYAIVGHGVPMPCVYHPSDLQLWVLWVASEYVLATRDRDFLNERIPLYPNQQPSATDPTILELLQRCFTHITSTIGVGEHGLQKIYNGDWNDSIVYTHLTPEQRDVTIKVGESVLNAAMATYVYDYFALLLDFIDHADLAPQAREKAQAQRTAVQAQWYESYYRRAWLSQDLGWVGEKQMWLAPQPWALIGRCVPPEKIPILIAAVDDLARKPSPIGALLQSQPDPTMKDEPGTGTNAGIFYAINGTLIWALALVDGEMAWDEWKKNTLAHHADIYPDMWFGTWSGPDAYNSHFAKQPGSTGVDFPVLNMHSHAWPLYSAIKLIGAEFHAQGLNLKPAIPLEDYEINTPLLGFRRSAGVYSGWYAPSTGGNWTISIALAFKELEGFKMVRVNGVVTDHHSSQGQVRFSGDSAPGAPLRWEIRL
jgi:hypothetical protein